MTIEVNNDGSVDLDSFLNNINDIQLVDVRSEVEWNEGHYEQAISMPLDKLSDMIEDLDPTKPTVFICAKGFRAALGHKVYQLTFPDAATNGYVVTEVDYSGDKPVAHVLPKEWHQEIIDRLKDM